MKVAAQPTLLGNLHSVQERFNLGYLIYIIGHDAMDPLLLKG